MANEHDDELERLLAELAPQAADREQLLEAHRQLEKDLLRLADPPPPPDFLIQVMAKVAQAPAPMAHRQELWSAAIIGLGSLAASLLTLVASGFTLAGLGLRFVQLLLTAREQIVGLTSAAFAVWRTAGLPLSVVAAALMVFSVVAFKRMSMSNEAKVSA